MDFALGDYLGAILDIKYLGGEKLEDLIMEEGNILTMICQGPHGLMPLLIFNSKTLKMFQNI